MELKQFNAAEMMNIDGGRLAVAIQQHVERCLADCHDRPSLEKMRKVKIVLGFTPVADEEGDLDSVNVSFHFDEAMPARKSRSYNMRADGDGSIYFNELTPGDASTPTLPLGEPKGPRRAVGDES